MIEKHADYIKIHRPEAYIDFDVNDIGFYKKSTNIGYIKSEYDYQFYSYDD